MKSYPPSSIIILPERQRQEFDPQAHEDLKRSIEQIQLLHPIVVRTTAEGPVLVSGERRLRAIIDIFALEGDFSHDGVVYTDQVPTVDLGELSPLEAEEAELDENLKRKDLTWQEHAAAVRRLHQLRAAQKAEDQAAPQTVADTTRELYPQTKDRPDLGWYHDNTRKEILVAKNLDKPEVAKAKTLDEAFKVLKRSEASEANIALAAQVGATFTADLHRLFNVNCVEWMAAAVPEQFDVILTDPPYGVDAQNFGDGAGKLSGIVHRYDDSHESWVKLMADWTRLSFRVAKPKAHAYVFCDIDRFHELKTMMQAAGWYVFRTPLIDYKLNSGRVPLPDRGPRRQYEIILYAIKGEKTVTNIYPDVIPCKADENFTHGAQKPVSLYQNLLMRSIRPGDKVLDSFAGSGTIFPAAHVMQCEATGLEQNPEYFGMCLGRLKELKSAGDPLSELTA